MLLNPRSLRVPTAVRDPRRGTVMKLNDDVVK
jgi:hypothetical protein